MTSKVKLTIHSTASERNDYIISKLKEGLTEAAVGRELGLSRQRVNQIIRNLKAKPNPDSYITISQLAFYLSLNKDTVRSAMRSGKLSFVKFGSRYFIPKSDIFARKCPCGRPVPISKKKYCSMECYTRALRERARQRLLTKFSSTISGNDLTN